MRQNHYYAFITDFSGQDGYVGAMKGRLLQLDPHAYLVDIAHDIPPFDIRKAAFCLFNSYHYFPEGTVFIVVVDPGVGSSRRALVVQDGRYSYVGPDNGVFSLIYWKEKCRIFAVPLEKLDTPVSSTFHGRDVFVPVAAQVMKQQLDLEDLPEVSDPVTFWRKVQPISEGRWQARVLVVDRFGNAILNIHRSQWQSPIRRLILPGSQESISRFCRTFSDIPPGSPGLLWDSSGFLQIAVNQGSAAKLFHLKADTPVVVET